MVAILLLVMALTLAILWLAEAIVRAARAAKGIPGYPSAADLAGPPPHPR